MEKVSNNIKRILKISLVTVVFIILFLAVLNYFDTPYRFITDISPKTRLGYIETVDGTYIGDLEGSAFQGTGEFRFDTGETYNGDWHSNNLQGYGTLVYESVGSYTGEYEQSLRSGDGIFTWENGDMYKGEWKEDKMSGEGMFTFASGVVLSGIFEDNTFISGKIAVENESGTYTCQVINGELNSQIKIVFSDGTVYEGEFQNNSISGEGAIVYPNGDEYEGQFIDGKKSGKGTYKWNSGASYAGGWESDKMDGVGKYYYNGFGKNRKLEGSFSNNVPVNECIYYDESGKKYLTTWSNGKCIKVVKG